MWKFETNEYLKVPTMEALKLYMRIGMPIHWQNESDKNYGTWVCTTKDIEYLDKSAFTRVRWYIDKVIKIVDELES